MNSIVLIYKPLPPPFPELQPTANHQQPLSTPHGHSFVGNFMGNAYHENEISL